MARFFDRVKDTTTTTGTGAKTLSGTPPTGFRAFVSSLTFANGEEVEYTITSADGSEWEVGLGVLSGTTTLTTVRVIASSNSNNAVSFSAGTKTVFGTISGERASKISTMGRLQALRSVTP